MGLRAAFYKGTRPGFAGIYSRGVRVATKGKYSHCELIFSDGVSASASFVDGGVRFKQIEYSHDHWDFIDLPDQLEGRARIWFGEHKGDGYDLLGNIHFLAPVIGDDKDKWSCAESVAAALQMKDPWRYSPNSLAVALKTFNFWESLKGSDPSFFATA